MEKQQKATTQITYYHAVFGRPAKVKMFFMSVAMTLSYFFRVPIEVIVRRNMGEDYFNLLLSILIGLAFILFPIFAVTLFERVNWELLLRNYLTWYAYTGLYVYSVFQRYREILKMPSIWEYQRYTMSEGAPLVLSELFGFPIPQPGYRKMSTLIEPGVFLIAGVILTLFMQPIGYVFILFALIYSSGYAAAFSLGEQFIKDKINQIVFNQEVANAFLKDEKTGRGVNLDIPIPNDPEMRKKVYDECINPDNVVDVDYEEVK